MPLVNTNVTVTCLGNGGGSATLIVNADNGTPGIPIPVIVYNPGVTPLYLGGASVTPSNGTPLAIGGTSSWNLSTGNNLYAIANTATTTVSITKGQS